MPFTNIGEAMREIDMDINEGVDIIMIKPAIPYLDIIYQVRKSTTCRLLLIVFQENMH